MIGYRQHGRRRSGDEIRGAAEPLHRQGRRQGGRDDRAGVAERIRAHDQFEGVEGARQRRRESGRDRPRRAATDQSAQVLPAQSQEDAGPRGDRRADLGVTGLEPHRGATAVGDQGLRDHKEAVAERELSAVQGVGLDRIDGRRRFSRAPPSIHEPEREPAETKRGQRGDRANPGACAQPLVERQAIDPDVREFRDFRHRDHADARDGADEDRDRHLRKSVRANERSQGRRRGGERAPGKDRHCRTRIAVMPRRMDHSQARGQQKNPRLRFRGIRERDITELSVQFVLGAAAHGEHLGKAYAINVLTPIERWKTPALKAAFLLFNLKFTLWELLRVGVHLFRALDGDFAQEFTAFSIANSNRT